LGLGKQVVQSVWLETKLMELGMLTYPGYKFCFVLDETSMFAVTSRKKMVRHSVITSNLFKSSGLNSLYHVFFFDQNTKENKELNISNYIRYYLHALQILFYSDFHFHTTLFYETDMDSIWKNAQFAF